ncbi:hypothetical protein ACIBBE_42295 [Streptomyces sp. NPDC051644]|uniref:hypothetical protein n=1 Tax=Streptomyces sp. NPDC051644 TaxID=3365666 RepID=UPI00379B5819
MAARKGALTLRPADVLDAFAAGASEGEAAQALGVSAASVRAHTNHLCDQAQLKTLRALVYTHEARRRAGDREPGSDLDPLTELVWAGLRLNVPDQALVPEIATAAGAEPAEVRAVLDRLAVHYETSWHGLIRLAFRHGVLSGLEGTAPTGVRVGQGGSGIPWDLGPIRLWVLELTASGLGAEQCARRTGISRATVYAHVRECAQAACVESRRALMHEALRVGVLAPPEPAPAPNVSDAAAAVWRGMVLDVSNADLPNAIGRQTGLAVSEVAAELKQLRSTGTSDCLLVVEGWASGVLGEEATVLDPAGHRPVVSCGGSRAGTGSASMKLTGREQELLTLIAVRGHTVEQAGVYMRIGDAPARKHLRSCLRAAQTSSLRVLTHKACRALLLPAETVPVELEVSDDALTVWRGLVLDVPEDRLPHGIAAMTGLPLHRVQACLGELRATGLSDCQLVVEGWARGILDAQAKPKPWVPAACPAAVPHAQRPGRTAHPLSDALGLVPPGHRRDHASGVVEDYSGLNGVHMAGEVFDFVRISPGTCRALLERIDVSQWGPVLGLSASDTAVLVTAAGVVGSARRGAVGRLWARGGLVRLPEYGRRVTADGAYWAVPAYRPLWDPTLIAWILSPHEPAAPEPDAVPRALQPAGRMA